MGIVIAVILLFLGIGVLVVIHICIAGRSLERRFVASGITVDGDENRRNRSSRSMSKDDLEKLPSFDYLVKGSSSHEDCAVCLENFKGGEKCRLLPLCNHSFHAQCVDSWLVRNPICPICRTCADDDHHHGGLLVGQESGRFGYSDRSSGSGGRGGNEVRIEVVRDGHVITERSSESSEMQIDLGMIQLSATNMRVL